MGEPTYDVELVEGRLDGTYHWVEGGWLVISTFRGGVDADGNLMVGQIVYRDSGRRTAEGRRVFVPEGQP
jgi:hypothetical protein